MGELERDLEAEIVAAAIRLGWLCWKFVSPGLRGVPDRFFLRDGRVLFVEIKKSGEKPTRQQEIRGEEIRAHGGEWHWVDSLEAALVVLG